MTAEITPERVEAAGRDLRELAPLMGDWPEMVRLFETLADSVEESAATARRLGYESYGNDRLIAVVEAVEAFTPLAVRRAVGRAQS